MIERLKNNWLIFVIGIVMIVILFIINSDVFNHSEANNYPIISSAHNLEVEDTSLETTVIVDVKGAVNHPGVYEVDQDVRINDVIKMAGGFSENADEVTVNLAQKVYDELVIFVPEKGETETAVNIEGGQAVSGAIRINYATREEIETLPGIGPSKAAAIIKYREENGHFQTIDDLLEISGIGKKTLENMEDEIQIP